MTREDKQIAHEILAGRYDEMMSNAVRAIEPRLGDYFDELIANPYYHNGYELLCAVKFLRLLSTYEFNERKVHQVLRLREGEWKTDKNGRWQYVKGGIKQPLTSGDAVLRWEPFQVFILAYIYGPQAWIDTQLTEDDRETLLLTERINPETGHIEDLRRLCTNFTLYGPRKIDKTGISAFVAQEHFMLEDTNSESYCCANSSDQAKILYKRIKHGLQQLDPEGKRLRITETVCDWRAQYQNIRNSSIRPLSAGGKTKDGMFAQLCCADEYGSAAYTNNKCDMKRLVDVTESSMGPRREPLTVTTTTAGRITEGPFIEQLSALHDQLMREIAIAAGEVAPSLDDDRISCVLFEPDDWEKESLEEVLSSKEVRRKINPMLGKIVQHSFYDGSIAKARLDGDLGEVISKLFNVYQSAQAKPWLTAADIYPLQQNRRVTDLNPNWVCFAGGDFSKGDDLNALSWLCYNIKTGEFFADCDAWITEETLAANPNHAFYQAMAQKGWLRVCKGRTISEDDVLQRVIEVANAVDLQRIGYDAYDAKRFINAIGAWIFSMGQDPSVYLQPVSQTFATYNSPVQEMDYMIKNNPPLIHFSNSPLWPWEFGNCMLQESTDGMENKKPVKSSANAKVDNVQALLSALSLYDAAQGTIQK